MQLQKKDYFLVGVQIVLFILYYFHINFVEFLIPQWIQWTLLVFIGIGIVIFIISIIQLNKNLSPFPTPRSDSQLVQTGLYKYIRHPVYTGILISFGSYALYSGSIYRLIITLILYLLFLVKSRYEEEQLMNRYDEYGTYRKKTGRFFPKI